MGRVLMPNYNLIAARCEMDHYVLCCSSNVRVEGNIRHMLICMSLFLSRAIVLVFGGIRMASFNLFKL